MYPEAGVRLTTMTLSVKASILMVKSGSHHYCTPSLTSFRFAFAYNGLYLHRKRRKPLEPFFSRKGITHLQSMLAEVALHLETKLRERAVAEVFHLDHAFSAFSGDIIGKICLDNEDLGRFLDHPEFVPDWLAITLP
jgi:hypothetical protein